MVIRRSSTKTVPDSWLDLRKSLKLLRKNDIESFVAPSHFMWHLAIVVAEKHFGGPSSLDVLIAAHMTNRNHLSAQDHTLEQKMTALADMVANEKENWYFDYYLVGAEVCQEVVKMFPSAIKSHHRRFRFVEVGVQILFEQFFLMLAL